MKKLISILILIIIAAALVFFLKANQAGAPEELPEDLGDIFSEDERTSGDLPNTSPDSATEVTARGEIVSINTDEVALDGPAIINIRKSDGIVAVIAVPSMGLPLCVARENIQDPFSLKVGDEMEVRGTWTSNGEIVPCEGQSHYLRFLR